MKRNLIKILKENHKQHFFYSEKFDFAYCNVKKVGSTYWTKLFVVLEYGVQSGEQLYNISRADIHKQNYKFRSFLSKIIEEERKTVLVTRDPYSRLYSAYVDKIFLSFRQIEMLQPITAKKQCFYNTSFQEFLDMIIEITKLGNTLDPHFRPISSLCEPCKVNPFLLVKQETFESDVAFAMKSVGVDVDTYEFLVLTLEDQRAEFAIPGIVKSIYNLLKTTKKENCFTWDDVSRRVWKSFQIQGYLDKNVDFPKDKLHSESLQSNDSYVTDIILRTISENRMSSEMSKAQRYEFLCDAYREIPAGTLTEIQNIYQEDFTLFGYNNQPPCYGEFIKG